MVLDGREMETILRGLNGLIGKLAESPSMKAAVEEDYCRALVDRLQKLAGRYPARFLGADRAKAIIESAAIKGAQFTVVFVKRDGSVRRMRARVQFADKSGLRFDPEPRALVLVHDIEKDAPRMVPLDRVISVRVHSGCDETGLD
jgi:hypothetical protein